MGLAIVLGFLTIVASSPCLCPGDRFTDMDDGTVRDNKTGLIWFKDANTFGDWSWNNAMNIVAVLSHGDHGLTDGSIDGDWRLPTKEEWQDFVDTDYENPALSNTAGDGQWTENDPFLGVYHDDYWTSTEYNDESVWLVHLDNGQMEVGEKWDGIGNDIWPVRDIFLTRLKPSINGEPAGYNRF